MTQRLKIGLIGAGVFAGYHANKLAVHPRLEFVGVHDPDARRAAALAKTHNLRAMDAEALVSECDAMVIACPASFHGQMAIAALEAGCHCLIEKPLAVGVSDAERIVELSLRNNLIVQVGHQERMVLRAIGFDKIKETPLRVEAFRANGYSQRGTDTSVTMDLMTHDIDLCTTLFGVAPDDVSGQSRAVKSKTPDEAEVTLIYSEAKAVLRASRVTETPQRRMVLTYPSGAVEIDFNSKTLTHDTLFNLNANFGDDPRAKDSLGAATKVFVDAVLDGTPVLVSAGDGLIAVRVAAQIDGDLT